MPKPIVLTVADDAYRSQWIFVGHSQERYAKVHDYDRILDSAPSGGLNMKWSKLLRARDLLRTGADVMLIDADAEITDFAPAFHGILTDHPDQDIFYVEGISGRANSGLLILRGQGGIAAEFLDACLAARLSPVSPEDFVTSDGENGHVIAVLKAHPFAERSHVLPLTWNCSQPEYAADAYVRHYTNYLRQALFAGALPFGPSALLTGATPCASVYRTSG